jgi:hypothetical protein
MSDLNNSTAIVATFADIAKAVKAHDSRMATLVTPLVQAGVDPVVALKPEGAWYDDFRAGVAAAYLTAAQAAAVMDPAVSGKAKVGKLTKADLTKRLSSSVSKVRAAVIKAMGATTQGDAPKGAKRSEFETMLDRIVKDRDTLVAAQNGTSKSKFWSDFTGDVTDARRALDMAVKALEALQ